MALVTDDELSSSEASVPINPNVLLSKITWRLIPFLSFLYFIAFLDRVNVSFAALGMNKDLGLTAYEYGLGAGLFFVGYLLFQVPSNLLLQRFGARVWLAILMLVWGIVSSGTGFAVDKYQFYLARLLLGVAEAGFFPGLVLFITCWFPAERRAKVIAGLLVSLPIASVIGAPLSSLIMNAFEGSALAGWRWLFIIEAAPAILCAVLMPMVLPNSPADARWLTSAEKRWLTIAVADDRRESGQRRAAVFVVNVELLRYGLAYFGLLLGMSAVTLWLPQIIKAGGVSSTNALLLSAVPYCAAAIAMIGWSKAAEAHGSVVARDCWLPALVAALALAGVTLTSQFALDLILLSIAASGGLASIVIFWTLPTAAFSATERPFAIAAINTIGSFGAFVGPFAVGWLHDITHNFTAGLWVLSAAVAMAALLLAMPRRAGKLS